MLGLSWFRRRPLSNGGGGDAARPRSPATTTAAVPTAPAASLSEDCAMISAAIMARTAVRRREGRVRLARCLRDAVAAEMRQRASRLQVVRANACLRAERQKACRELLDVPLLLLAAPSDDVLAASEHAKVMDVSGFDFAASDHALHALRGDCRDCVTRLTHVLDAAERGSKRRVDKIAEDEAAAAAVVAAKAQADEVARLAETRARSATLAAEIRESRARDAEARALARLAEVNALLSTNHISPKAKRHKGVIPARPRPPTNNGHLGRAMYASKLAHRRSNAEFDIFSDL